MKKPILPLLFAALCLAASTSWADRYGTLAGVGDTATLLKGETALVMYASGNTEVLYQKGTATAIRFTISGNSINSISPLPLVGPATITCRTTDSVIGFRVVATSGPADNEIVTGLPSTAVVIPADGSGGGGAEVLLESSPDMVNWTSTLPGTFGVDSPNRFFRVRVIQK